MALESASRRASRWWLAGLLVTCLLPASLAQTGSFNHAERLVQACILVPLLRRASRRVSVRHRTRQVLPRHAAIYAVAACCLQRFSLFTLRHAVAAHDVLTRRGPPSCP